ncbi:hybrid sensor histidine kinase/response regulator transcription factor [Paenibacillus alvei]|uniref:Uncharacterized protein n=1 Tax=Paenibacillus alvei TaxID=44250 RepID=A0A383RGX6_PAEAL|nr:hybrid sensor histidine kinase/response regulator transcription factor [Paenibacillus alvei]SYX86268.1 conserved membrane protein of unknown function [Paenibacillus alvei]
MKDWIKRWSWPEWVTLCIRVAWWITLVIGLCRFYERGLPIPLWGAIGLSLVPLFIPIWLQHFQLRWYLTAEIVLSGSFVIFLNLSEVSNIWHFTPIVFVIGLLSSNHTYRWTAVLSSGGIPFILGWVNKMSWFDILIDVILHYGIVFALGYAFQLAVLTHKQGQVIKEQNRILEQHVTQVEQMILIEERNRLSKELHDTIGHTLTSLIMGMESLRQSATGDQTERIDALLRSARSGLDEVRTHLHQMSSSTLPVSFTASLQKLVSKFKDSTGIKVKFRTLGEEYDVPNPIKLTLYRCLQEALTNAARHGQATAIEIHLHFEANQLRLQIQDNGIGNEQLQLGFGLSTMKERLLELSGHLSVHSHLDEGTVVLCTVPRNDIVHSKIRLVIADDQQLVVDSLSMILDQQQGLQVVGTAGNGIAAVELCEQVHPDVILMDVRMPEMDGIEALQVLKEKWPDLRVIIMSTFSDVEQAVISLQHGAVGYLLKSIQPKDLIDTIRLIHAGGMSITQEIAEQVFKEMKEQRVLIKERRNFIWDNPYGLIKREFDLLDLLHRGSRYKTIAANMNLSEGTIRNYISILYSKLGVNNRQDAVDKAKEEGLIS